MSALTDAIRNNTVAQKELAALKERLAEYDETYRRILAEECAPDEQHCTCVPALRMRIAEAERVIARVVEARTKLRSTTINWQEQCLFDCDDILTSIVGDQQGS